MRIKTNQEREARKQRNKAKRGIKQVKKDVFSAIRGIVNAQTELDKIAKEAGITEEEMEELKKGEVNAVCKEEESNQGSC